MVKFIIYGFIINNKLQWKVTGNLEVDLTFWHNQGYNELIIIDSSLSIGKALAVIDFLSKKPNLLITNNSSEIKLNTNRVRKYLEKFNLNNSIEELKTSNGFENYLSYYAQVKKSVLPFFEGKILLFEELNSFITNKRVNIKLEELITVIQVGYLLNEIKISSGVIYPNTKNLQCNRCGSIENIYIRECNKCKESCAVCEQCITLGRSKTCSPLLTFSVNNKTILKPPNSTYFDDRNYNLTGHQEEIALQLIENIKNSKRDFLVWAVTGAGKTEMVFPAIKFSLENKQRILFASPRKDVIKELSPRFKNNFNTSIITLYGGSEEKWEQGNLYLATTHQILRFHNFFDLAIIDEIDAFPYYNQPLLQNGVKRALKENGKLIYMSATPSNDWLLKVMKDKIEMAKLPIRYHYHPLPIPQTKLIPHKKKINKLNKPIIAIKDFIEKVELLDGQALIFVPEISEIIFWTNKLKEWFKDKEIEGVYASKNNRDTIVGKFKKGTIRILVTTTIMERGITIPNVHVLVIRANANIFSKSTLIQIAGRVGRTIENPNGVVIFLGEYITKDMNEAKREIENMNRLAKKLTLND